MKDTGNCAPLFLEPIHPRVLLMSKMSAYPPELTDPVWKKKKSITAGETGIGAELRKLKTAYDNIDWEAFEKLDDFDGLDELKKAKGKADSELSKVTALTKALTKFKDFAARKATEMKSPTNAGTKKLLIAMSVQAKSLADDWDDACAKRISAAETELTDYPKRLKAWIQRKEDLLEEMKKSKTVAEIQVKKANELAAANDQDAKAMPQDANEIKNKLKEMANRAAQIDSIAKSLKKRNEEMHQMFDPHRSATENPSTHKLSTKDTTGKYSSIFTDADNLRAEMIGMQESIEDIFKEALTSVKEGQAATLQGNSQSMAYEQIATNLVENYATLGKRMEEYAGMKSILMQGKDYTQTWKTYIQAVEMQEPSKRAEMKVSAKDRAKQRFDQVNDLEVQLERMYKTGLAGFTKALNGIPQNMRGGEALKKINRAQLGIDAGKAYLDRWKDINQKGTVTYHEAMKAIDEM
jgi:hypothetical protein